MSWKLLEEDIKCGMWHSRILDGMLWFLKKKKIIDKKREREKNECIKFYELWCECVESMILQILGMSGRSAILWLKVAD